MQTECIIQSDRFLMAIAISGEIKIHDLEVLGLSRSQTYIITSKLEKDNLVRADQIDKYKTLRLTTVGKRYLKRKYPGVFDRLFVGRGETNKIRTEPNRRDRNIKLAQIKIMLMQAGVNLLPENKVLMDNDLISNRTDGTDGVDYSNHFYTSSELKARFETFLKCRNSRALGILITSDNICVLYNTGDRVMRWCEEDERKFRTIITTQINQKYYKNTKNIKNVIVFSKDEVPQKIFENQSIEKTDKLRLDRSVQNMHVLTSGKDNRIILDLLIGKINYSEAIRKLLPALGLSRKSEMSQSIFDEEGRKVLLAFDMDLKKIDAFCKQIGVYDKGNVIYCFDFQKKYIESYCKNACTINTITEGKFRNAIE